MMVMGTWDDYSGGLEFGGLPLTNALQKNDGSAKKAEERRSNRYGE